MKSLATLYRPKTLDEVVGQSAVKLILNRQVNLKQYKHAYLFAGGSGLGKTTIARALANAINEHKGKIIEVDGASNNGVDNVRSIINEAQELPLTSKYKIFLIDECVTGDTEVLTDKGFKRFDSLDKTEKIAQYNQGKIEFVKPLEYIERDYQGKIYEIKINKKASFLMTPNHVQPLYNRLNNDIKESYIKDIKFNRNAGLILSGEGTGKEDTLTADDRIVIALQADGTLQHRYSNYNYWTIEFKKERKINRFLELLKTTSFQYKEIKGHNNLLRRFSLKVPTTITKTLSTYFDLTSMSKNYANEFIEELMHWDGYKYADKRYYYYSSTSKDNVDFCQAVGILGGYSSKISVAKDNRKESFKDIYRIIFVKRNYSRGTSKVKKIEVDYSGKIYCVKVPSHNIIIRKNGFELVTGNCHSITTQGWQAFLKTLEEPPSSAIFMFCTTEPNKVPLTIQNRVMRFNLTKLSLNEIIDRLKYICNQEKISIDDESLTYISKLANGGMRDAISLLEKCIDYAPRETFNNELIIKITIKDVLNALGSISYETMFKLVNAIIDGDRKLIINIIDDIDLSGQDLKQFNLQLLDFIFQLNKYCIFQDIGSITIPSIYKNQLDYTTGIENNIVYFDKMRSVCSNAQYQLKNDTMPKLTILNAILNLVGSN